MTTSRIERRNRMNNLFNRRYNSNGSAYHHDIQVCIWNFRLEMEYTDSFEVTWYDFCQMDCDPSEEAMYEHANFLINNGMAHRTDNGIRVTRISRPARAA